MPALPVSVSVRVFVAGLPAPQGSKRHVGRGVMVESSKRLKPWREDVRQGVLAVLGDAPPLDGPCIVRLTFWLPRPKSHPKTRRTLPVTTPDLDKLARGVLDALTSAGAIRDDSIVVTLPLAEFYVHPEPLRYPCEPTTPGVGIDANTLGQAYADLAFDPFGRPSLDGAPLPDTLT